MTPQRKKPLARSTKPIKRHTRLQSSRTPIAKQRADPTRRRFAKHRVKPFTDWLKTQRCCVTGQCQGDWRVGSAGFFMWWVDPAHIKTRATGGDDLYNCVPLATHLHEEQHRIGWPAFERKYGIDAKQIARDLTEQWFATEDGQAWQDQHSTEEA